MSALSVSQPFPIFTDTDGSPLENGYIWIGTVNLPAQTNPIAVYWDAALTIPATQPIRTQGGYPSRNGSPARLYVNSDYSILVQNKNGSMVYSAPAATERIASSLITGLNASQVVYDPAGTGAVPTTVQAKLRETVSVKDFGAVGDGAADDTAAIQAALDYAATLAASLAQPAGILVNSSQPAVEVHFPPGKYKVTAQIVVTTARIRLFGENALLWTGVNGVLPASYLVKFTAGYYTVVQGLSFGSTETGCIEFDCPNVSSAVVRIIDCAFMGNVSGGVAVGTAIKYSNQSSSLFVENCQFRDVKHPFEHVSGDAVRFGHCWFDNVYAKSYADDTAYFNSVRTFFTVEDSVFSGGPGDKGTRVAYFNCENEVELTIRRCRIAFENGGGPVINWKVPIVLTNGSFIRSGFSIEDITTSPRGQNETYHTRTATPLVRLYQMPNRMVFRNVSWRNTIQGVLGVAPTTTLETLYQAAKAALRNYTQLTYEYDECVGNEMYLVPTTDGLVNKKWLRLFNMNDFNFEVVTAGNQATHYVRTYFTGADIPYGSFNVSAQVVVGAGPTINKQWLVSVILDNGAGTYSFNTAPLDTIGAVNSQNITLTPKFYDIAGGTYSNTISSAATLTDYLIAFEATKTGTNNFNFPRYFYVRPMDALDAATLTTGTPRQYFFASA